MRIVLVEDDEAVRTFVERLLQEKGHRVLSFDSGEDALTHVQDTCGIDVLIADMALPGMTGLILAHWIASRNAALPIVLTSGYPQNRDFTEASRYGWQLLPKPFKAEALLDAIERARSDATRRNPTPE